MRSDHAAGRSYGRRGRTPVIRSSGKRFGCNMISAITNRGRLYFMVLVQEFKAPVFVTFLERLLRQIRRKIFLILDGHPVLCQNSAGVRWGQKLNLSLGNERFQAIVHSGSRLLAITRDGTPS